MNIIYLLIVVFMSVFSKQVVGKSKLVFASGIFGIWLSILINKNIQIQNSEEVTFLIGLFCVLVPIFLTSFKAIYIFFQKLNILKIINKFTLKKQVKRNVCILVILIIILGIGIKFYKETIVKVELINKLTELAKENGLENVEIVINSSDKLYNIKVYNISVYCSNLDKLGYNNMFDLNDSLDLNNVIITNYFSGEDVYEIFSYTRSIYKNGNEIYGDYLNSESHKSAIKSNTDSKNYNYVYDPNKKNMGDYTVTKGVNGMYTYRCNRCGNNYKSDTPIGWKGCIKCDNISSEEWYDWYKKAIGFSEN